MRAGECHISWTRQFDGPRLLAIIAGTVACCRLHCVVPYWIRPRQQPQPRRATPRRQPCPVPSPPPLSAPPRHRRLGHMTGSCCRAQPGGWTYTMTPAAMWCEFMKMFHRQLGTCYILVHEFPADMSGYQGGALSKLLVQSLRPEWNKQEIASVRVDLVELQECITATGVVTPDDEQQMESSTALQKPELQRRRSALSFMFCCSRDSNRSPPPPPEPTSSVQDLPDQPTSSGSSSNSGNNNSSANNNNNNSSANNKPLNEVNQEEEEEDEEGAEARPYDPCTPWDSM
ncbi:hypothetical protein FOCC_FOCC006538 [Frankliniella occidentalis]|nr:hypothetical protein FOCC_FOCC006538 [Frankliniella occidentalis]